VQEPMRAKLVPKTPEPPKLLSSSLFSPNPFPCRTRRGRQHAYTASCGACVRTGRRQSIPSSNIESCAGVKDTVPLVACGHRNLPRSSLFEKRRNPSPSNHRTLIKSPRLQRKIYTWPENGLSCSVVCTIPLNPVNPRHMSVTPETIQIRVPAASPIIATNAPAPCAVLLHPHCLRRKYVPWEIPPGLCPLQLR
jgi:hypothetical protein